MVGLLEGAAYPPGPQKIIRKNGEIMAWQQTHT
jgi:hypothetical protein